MSESDAPANTPDTTTDEQDDKATWSDVKSESQQLREQRKEITFELPSGKVAEFEYRMLTAEEKNEISNAAVTISPSRTGQDDDVSVDQDSAEVLTIKYGVTAGPQGFTNSEREIKAMIPDMREALANAIEEFSTMDDQTRQCFR